MTTTPQTIRRASPLAAAAWREYAVHIAREDVVLAEQARRQAIECDGRIPAGRGPAVDRAIEQAIEQAVAARSAEALS